MCLGHQDQCSRHALTYLCLYVNVCMYVCVCVCMLAARCVSAGVGGADALQAFDAAVADVHA
jgi:hypothetical protein